MAGIRYNPDNEELALLQDLLNDLFKSIDMMGASFSHFPILCYVAPEASGYNRFVRCHENLYEFFRKEVENHKRNFNPTDDPNDLIEAYLRVLYSGDDESGQIHESFSELQLLAILLDIFMAGSETTMKTLNFMFLYLVRNTSIQKKARREIDRVVGRNRLPKLDDRVK
jgi:cytochrome P450